LNASPGEFVREHEAALLALRAAAGLCRRVQNRRLVGSTLTKEDRSPVTIADFGSQALVGRTLLERLPGDEIVGEEDSAALVDSKNAAIAQSVFTEVRAAVPGATDEEILTWIGSGRGAGGSGRFWTLDPIDGTKGFLRGEQYAVALALVRGGAVEVGALACPNLRFRGVRGWILVAVRGAGAEALPLDDGPPHAARVSPVSDARSARLLESVEAAHGDLGGHERVRERLGVAAPGLRLDSQAKYALLALGEAEVYLRLPTSEEYRENLWDHAAGALVVEEAGGRVTDVHGRPLDFTTGRRLENNQGIVATNGRLHDAFLAAVGEVRARRR